MPGTVAAVRRGAMGERARRVTSSWASRSWTTTGFPDPRPPGRAGGPGPRAARPAGRGCGENRDRSPPRPGRRGPRRGTRAPPSPLRTRPRRKCGWMPTAASTGPGGRPRGRSPPRTSARSQPGTRIRVSPAARARSRTASRSYAKTSCWRWAWASTIPGRRSGTWRRLRARGPPRRPERRRRPRPVGRAGPGLDAWRAPGSAPQASSASRPGPPFPRSSYAGGVPIWPSRLARRGGTERREQVAQDPAGLPHRGQHDRKPIGLPRLVQGPRGLGFGIAVAGPCQRGKCDQGFVEVQPLQRGSVRGNRAVGHGPHIGLGIGLFAVRSRSGSAPSR